MNIISASRRTDIPAFYSNWFLQRVRAGYLKVISPFNNTIKTVSLEPHEVIAIVFWTKDAGPMLKHLLELKDLGYVMYFLYTVNNYSKILEPKTPNLRHTLETMEEISEQFDKKVIRWRYDPVVVTSEWTFDRHLQNFNELCSFLHPFTDHCIFSFCDFYQKTIRKMAKSGIGFSKINQSDALRVALEMAQIAKGYELTMLSCAHNYLAQGPIQRASCIDADFISDLADSQCRKDALASLKLSKNRPQCGCAESVDIGAYNTCYHQCVYCYATTYPKMSPYAMQSWVDKREWLDPMFKGSFDE
ncbi:MAG: DUF1848 domain-containing protein [Syntrophaceae bacterium]|nr:DUF1848 domain-containing protein [Syntrophaceae bacterium]